jgi:hypothetical protein
MFDRRWPAFAKPQFHQGEDHVPNIVIAQPARPSSQLSSRGRVKPGQLDRDPICFTMTIAFGLQGAGFTPTELDIEARSLLSQKARDSASVGRL